MRKYVLLFSPCLYSLLTRRGRTTKWRRRYELLGLEASKRPAEVRSDKQTAQCSRTYCLREGGMVSILKGGDIYT